MKSDCHGTHMMPLTNWNMTQLELNRCGTYLIPAHTNAFQAKC